MLNQEEVASLSTTFRDAKRNLESLAPANCNIEFTYNAWDVPLSELCPLWSERIRELCELRSRSLRDVLVRIDRGQEEFSMWNELCSSGVGSAPPNLFMLKEFLPNPITHSVCLEIYQFRVVTGIKLVCNEGREVVAQVKSNKQLNFSIPSYALEVTDCLKSLCLISNHMKLDYCSKCILRNTLDVYSLYT